MHRVGVVIELTRQAEQQWGALLRRAAQGDADAFEGFYRHSVDWSLALARELVDETNVELLLTSMYVAAWEALHVDAQPWIAPAHWLEALARRIAEGC